ncbi:zinc finger protein 239-like [Anopheles bellator]|uniref:zinc finger protein 239-like n=1 Tax=Anopheles bellator TaxID=139047 RepID=UPI002647062D|nr:zinc finger protein 239-like [Anopheles bellator]
MSTGQICNHELINLDALIRHKRKHEPPGGFLTLRESYEIVDESYRCSRCPLQYTTEYLIARHLERVHGCQLAETLEMLQYMKRTAQEKLYRCKYCDRTYISLTRLKNHLTHHGPNGTLRHKCPCCGTYFETAEEARSHALAMHRERLECGSCGKQFQDPESLQSHIRYAHRGAKEARRFRFVCHRCGKNFPSRTVLTDHERSNCGETPLYRCDTCGKHYSSFCSLKAHQTVHEDRLAFACGYCQKRCRTKGQLKVHERSHTGEKPFQCEHCPKSFPYRESLVTHRSTHTGIKPHACDVCGQKFTCIANLQSHRRARRTTCGKDMNKRKPTNYKTPPESKGCK